MRYSVMGKIYFVERKYVFRRRILNGGKCGKSVELVMVYFLTDCYVLIFYGRIQITQISINA
jgi:hypothetical protein